MAAPPSPPIGGAPSAGPSSPEAQLEALQSIEHAAHFVASDVAQLLGGLQAGLQSVSAP